MKPKSAGCTDSGRTGNGTDTDDRCREVAGKSTWAARQRGGAALRGRRFCARTGMGAGRRSRPRLVSGRGPRAQRCGRDSPEGAYRPASTRPGGWAAGAGVPPGCTQRGFFYQELTRPGGWDRATAIGDSTTGRPGPATAQQAGRDRRQHNRPPRTGIPFPSRTGVFA